MKSKDKEAFEKRYDEQVNRGEKYDFEKELVDYCHSDVKLLKAGCEACGTSFFDIPPKVKTFVQFTHVFQWLSPIWQMDPEG